MADPTPEELLALSRQMQNQGYGKATTGTAGALQQVRQTVAPQEVSGTPQAMTGTAQAPGEVLPPGWSKDPTSGQYIDPNGNPQLTLPQVQTAPGMLSRLVDYFKSVGGSAK